MVHLAGRLGLESVVFFWSRVCSRAPAAPRPGASAKKAPRGWSRAELQRLEHDPAAGAAVTEKAQRRRSKSVSACNTEQLLCASIALLVSFQKYFILELLY